MPTYTYSFLGLVQQLTNLTAAPSHLNKGDLFGQKVPLSFFRTLPSLTPLPYTLHIACYLKQSHTQTAMTLCYGATGKMEERNQHLAYVFFRLCFADKVSKLMVTKMRKGWEGQMNWGVWD